ncbi:hypothetical protein CHS0354_005037, partial [Potamilus streckersoni]
SQYTDPKQKVAEELISLPYGQTSLDWHPAYRGILFFRSTADISDKQKYRLNIVSK